MLYKFLRLVSKILAKIVYRFKVIGSDNIQQSGKLIICANHMHVFDPIILATTTKRIIHFMAKKELFQGWKNRFMLSIHAIPVNRDGNDSHSLKMALQTLRNEEVLGIFPEGGRNVSGERTMKPGVSMLAVKTKTKIVPVYIQGTYRLFSKITAVIGKPFELDEYYGKKLSTEDHEYIANHIIANHILSLKSQIIQ